MITLHPQIYTKPHFLLDWAASSTWPVIWRGPPIPACLTGGAGRGPLVPGRGQSGVAAAAAPGSALQPPPPSLPRRRRRGKRGVGFFSGGKPERDALTVESFRQTGGCWGGGGVKIKISFKGGCLSSSRCFSSRKIRGLGDYPPATGRSHARPPLRCSRLRRGCPSLEEEGISLKWAPPIYPRREKKTVTLPDKNK